MAQEVDLNKLVQISEQNSARGLMLDMKGPSFDPMRRKLETRMEM